jgi:hypothetical protein
VKQHLAVLIAHLHELRVIQVANRGRQRTLLGSENLAGPANEDSSVVAATVMSRPGDMGPPLFDDTPRPIGG